MLNRNMYEDLEKIQPIQPMSTSSYLDASERTEAEPRKNRFLTAVDRVTSQFKLETRGVQRVEDDERTDTSLWSAASMWVAANLVISTFALGALGITLFQLGFYQCVVVIIFFTFLGAIPFAFCSIFGSKFGLRQMILSSFFVGSFGMRIFAAINCVSAVGWGAINIMTAAQLLHIVNNGALPPWVACIIIVLITIIVTFFGYRVIHFFEMYAWIPSFIVFIIVIARMARSGNFTEGEWATGKTGAGNVLSFGGTVFGFAAGWTTYAADYTTYMSVRTNPYKIFFAVLAGLTFPLIFTMILGAACATGTLIDEDWAEMYNNNSIGGLLYSVLVVKSLHGFGQFCCVLLALSTVSNNIPSMYSIAMCLQAVWSKFRIVPRIAWTIFGNFLTLAICIPAYYKFSDVMHNFMNCIGYYTAIYISMLLSEHFIYRRGFSGYNPDDYLDKSKLPIGIAGTSGFISGVVGAVLGMNQTWYMGVVSRQIGDYGGDPIRSCSNAKNLLHLFSALNQINS
ncbi:cytosine permease ASCRUDRAFT_5683 [Ascoidea rubescens DSM 1968]|uniref:Purine-cytosine permease n=1 Tax=Ascoidea rubescens DSM 1968 TaxID=1344418 RepID=A0A1D2VQ50_9ASCO|nr:hypothetical protein ASCRUDRAFT_5683 [Ascoidea rubescens DSM 1968]ODV63741.1 hypothetical protein ASCRUDRAFT_5683 [Ascoidea rubescens DSM 1968]